MDASFIPNAAKTLTTEAEHDALMNPTRQKILWQLTKEALSSEDLAQMLDLDKFSVKHHLELLLAAGLIQKRQKINGGSIPKLTYRSSALSFDVKLRSSAQTRINPKILEFLKNDLDQAIDWLSPDDNERLVGKLESVRIDRSKYTEFSEKLEALIQEFRESDSSDGEDYTLNLSLYPQKMERKPLSRYELIK